MKALTAFVGTGASADAGGTAATGASRAAAGLRWRSAPRWGCAPPLTPLRAGTGWLANDLIRLSGRAAAYGSGWKDGTGRG